METTLMPGQRACARRIADSHSSSESEWQSTRIRKASPAGSASISCVPRSGMTRYCVASTDARISRSTGLLLKHRRNGR